jgi:hypothetical protein
VRREPLRREQLAVLATVALLTTAAWALTRYPVFRGDTLDRLAEPHSLSRLDEVIGNDQSCGCS